MRKNFNLHLWKSVEASDMFHEERVCVKCGERQTRWIGFAGIGDGVLSFFERWHTVSVEREPYKEVKK